MAQRNIEIVQTKIDIPTILVEHEGRMLPIHSKYNPIAEAERLIDAYAIEIEKSDHLLFYGVGLGYHVKIAQERYPEKIFSVYEPIEQVSQQFVKLAKKTGVQVGDLAKNYTEISVENILPNLLNFSIYFAQRVILITLPIYEKLVPEEFQIFTQNYKQILKDKVSEKRVNKNFNERWIINMMMNVKHTFNTPNLLMQEKNDFEGKPVILVAAGPSLSDEIDNLRVIKERGLAYIFAVGSANRALLKHNLMPDAVLSYDPQGSNWYVFGELIENKITNIPLIFGTTVGYETVSNYPGPKAHVVIMKDMLTPHLHDAEMITVNDSSTISNVTFQILQKLNVGKVILVGQNFAYRDDQFYASGIRRYDKQTEEITDGKVQKIEMALSFYVEDVHGEQVRTNETFDTMRKEMELYLKAYPNLKVINTAKGGAKIEGAPFKSLTEIIDDELIDSVVNKDWYEQLNLPKTQLQQKKLERIYRDNQKFILLFDELVKEFNQLKRQSQSPNIAKLEKMLERCNKLLNKMHSNQIYVLFIRPIVNLFTEQIYAEVSLCNKMTDSNKKADTIANIYLNYLSNVLNAYEEISSVLQMNVFLPLLHEDTMKFYSSTSGVFHYEGQWNKLWLKELEIIEEDDDDSDEDAKKKEIHPNDLDEVLVQSSNSGDKIQFRFKGTTIQLFGTVQGDQPLKVKVTVDGKAKIVILKATLIQKQKNNIYFNEFFALDKLSNRLHDVSIEILSDDVMFIFTGIKIDVKGRAYHVQEVSRVEDLTIGKRIRCHYEATYNTVGEFSRLAEESADFLPIDAHLEPNGDFYFIMVDDLEGEKKLIADRSVRYNIDLKTLLMGLNREKKYDLYDLNLRLLDINDKNDEWVKYIKNNKFNTRNDELIWNHERIAHKSIGGYSLVTYNACEYGLYSKYTDDNSEKFNQHSNTHIESDISNPIFGFRPLLELKMLG